MPINATKRPLQQSNVTDTMTGRMGLFGATPQYQSRSEILKREAFKLLKPKCVPLMAIHTLSPETYHHNLQLVSSLHSTLLTIPSHAFTPSLINYTIFPLTHLLQRNNPLQTRVAIDGTTNPLMPDRMMEKIFECLAFLIERWKRTEAGLDVGLWEQLFVLSGLVLGGPIDSMPPGKGKGGGKGMEQGGEENRGKGKRILSEEGTVIVLDLMRALLEPISERPLVLEEDGEEEELKMESGTIFYPTPAIMSKLFESKILLPILFHTTTTLLLLSQPPQSNTIQIPSLRILGHLMFTYLHDRPEMLASVMPGIISSLSKTILTGTGGGKKMRGDVGVEIVSVLKGIITITLGDEGLQEMRVLQKEVGSLEELGPELNESSEMELNDDVDDDKKEKTKNTQGTPFPALTATYLEFTQTQLHLTFKSILPILQSHHSFEVRKETVAFCHDVLSDCFRALPGLQMGLLTCLLFLTGDQDLLVQASAKNTMERLLREEKGSSRGTQLYSRIKELAEKSLMGFPSALTSHSDSRARESTRLLVALSELVIDSRSIGSGIEFTRKTFFQDLLGPDGGVLKWVWPLLSSLELGRKGDMTGTGVGEGYAGRAWEMARIGNGYEHLKIEGSRRTGEGSSGAESSGMEGRGEQPGFPGLFLRHVDDPEVLREVGGMFQALGRAAGMDGLNVIEQFIAIAKAKRNTPDVAKAASALWTAERILTGLGQNKGLDEKKLRKVTKNIVRTLITFDEEDDMEDQIHDEEQSETQQEASDALVRVEQKSGLNALSNLLKRDHRGNKSAEMRNRRLHLQTHRELVSALSLALMSTCARIIGSDFRPLLLNTLYIVLSHLGSPVAFIRGYAEIALIRISYDIGYASPQNLIIDNVDYVINIVSQRMTYKRLSPLAPMVLISMIRLVGEPIVPLVQDIVDDIFDCLDSYHGYEMLASTMLAVLDTLMQAMTTDIDLATWTPPNSTSRRMRPGPDPQADFSALVTWYNERAVKASEAVDSFLEPTPQKPWGKEPNEGDDEEPEDSPVNARDEPEIPPTRTQEVCKMIMEKDIFFLTHSSPFIRARTLSLFSNGIPVLVTGNRESDLLPLVNTAWPYILNRLKDDHAYVVTEAAVVIENLAKWVGDFMSRRILDNAWPILKKLLITQNKVDERSALTKRGSSSSKASTSFTVSHRLYLAIINALQYIVKDVPVAESLLWEVIILFRPFLSDIIDQDLQNATVKLYKNLALRDGDAVWLALKGTSGEIPDHKNTITYLRQTNLDIRTNVERIL